MRNLPWTVAVVLSLCAAASAAEPKFAADPQVVKTDAGYRVSFAADQPTDATVAVVDKAGRVVRHLAFGVLGAKAPAPFQKDSLKQAIAWDGKDDAGQPAPLGCSVRVGLGTTPTFDRLIELEPPAVYSRTVTGVAVAADGTLFVMNGTAWERANHAPEIAAFRRDGTYLKTIVPFRADLPQERLQEVRFIDGPEGLRVESPYPNFVPGLQGIYRTTIFIGKTGPGDGPARLVCVSGRRDPFMKTYGGRRLLAIGLDGSVDKDFAGPMLPAGTLWSQRFFITQAPDGAIWLAGLYSEKLRKNTQQVYRAAWADKEFVPVLGEAGVAGADDAHFDQPRGLAFDAAGRLLVCDWMNDRIEVFSLAAGAAPKLVKTLAVPGPEQVKVHPKTGAIYVLSVRDRGKQEVYHSAQPIRWDSFADKSIIQFAGVDDFKEVARIDLPARPLYLHDAGPVLALDASADVPVVWVSCVGRIEPGDHLWRIEDRGDKLVGGPAPIERYYYPPGAGAGCVATDPATGDCYFAGRTSPTVLKIDGTTGAVTHLDKLADALYAGRSEMDRKTGYKPWQIAAMAVDREGRIYFRLIGQWSGLSNYIVRFNRDQTAAPFARTADLPPPTTQPDKTKFDIPGALRVTQPSHGYHLAGLGIGPDGDLYVIDEGPGGKHRDPSEYNVLNVFAPDGTLKKAGAFPFLTSSAFGPRFDSRGNMYLTEAVRPVGRPAGEETTGSLIKFKGAAGGLVFGLVDPPSGYELRRLERQILPAGVRNAEWIHYGVSPVPFGHCVCPSAPFDIDAFDRIAVSDADHYRVKLVDSAGNVIGAFGRFANRDSRGPASNLPTPAIPLRSVGSIASAGDFVYVFDTANNRILRVRLAAKAAKTVAVP